MQLVAIKRAFPGSLVVKDSELPVQGAQVRALVGKSLRSHLPRVKTHTRDSTTSLLGWLLSKRQKITNLRM